MIPNGIQMVMVSYLMAIELNQSPGRFGIINNAASTHAVRPRRTIFLNAVGRFVRMPEVETPIV
jgi:hypothetical protein